MESRLSRAAVCVAVTTLIAACGQSAPSPSTDASATAPLPRISGIESQYADDSVRIQDDFYRHVNGKWLASAEIPADQPGYGAFNQLYDDTQDQLRGLVEDAAKNPGGDAERQKIGALYASFMDEARLDQLGMQPLAADLARIDAVPDKPALAALIGTLASFGLSGSALPFAVVVHQDNRDSTRYVVDLEQGGLGLPDRDYYLKDDDAKLKEIRDEYRRHIERMLRLAGDATAAANAPKILALETALARLQWTKVTLRDPIKAYNKLGIDKLPRSAPGFDWPGYLAAAGLAGKTGYVIVGQPSYLAGFAKLLAQTPLPLWKTYLKWRLLDETASALSKPFVDEDFAFRGTALSGVPDNEPRWKRGVSVVSGSIGDALGKLYVARYFPPQNKARAEALVGNLLAAYRQSIDTLDWMSAETKQQAQAKLKKIAVKIGYPENWRDYSALVIARDDLFGNLRRANAYEYARVIGKLGQPIDRGEWDMRPQTVNAQYNPELNDITFPAAILQPPFFNVLADDAVNYGGIGAVIGHEISHGFDDQGAQYDGDGNLRDWFTQADHARFKARTQALVAEYNAFSPLPGYHLNGALTLGENIADNSGLAVAYRAYQISLCDTGAPVIDGLSGAQRFYLGFAQIWREKLRDNYAIELVTTDPHSPGEFRGNGAVVNQPGFYAAFDVKSGDRMYVPPERRVSIW